MPSPATTITLSTLRLLCGNNEQLASQGTGFLFNFKVDEQTSVPVILTNKHVVSGFSQLRTTVTTFAPTAQLKEDCTADGMIHHVVDVPNLQQQIVNHPDQQVDLCAILCAPFLAQYFEQPHMRHSFLNETWLLDQAVRQIVRPVERVLMIGYPNGLWDEVHNLPIVRAGLTGSHPLLNWNGRRQFMIDVSCFPGSSGSPVFLFEDGMYRSGHDSYTPGTRVGLLGVLWGGPVMTMEGRLEQRPVPTGAGDVPVLNAMMNLGYVVSADAILDIKAIILDSLKAP